MLLDCGLCKVRPWREGDEGSLVRHGDSRRIWMNLRDRFPSPYTPEDARDWVGHASSRDPVTDFAIEVDGEAAGGVGLVLGHDVERFSAETGYWLGEAFWGRGIATAALAGLVRHGFETLGLIRIYALPFADNRASCRVLEKCGFEREGLLRRSAVKEGVVKDQVLYAITREGIPGSAAPRG